MLLLLLAAFTSIGERVDAHLLLDDIKSAQEEIELTSRYYPDSKELLEASVRLFAKLGNQREMLIAWQKLKRLCPEVEERSDLIEAMGWGLIDKGFSDASPLIRAIALIAAKASGSFHGVSLLLRGMQDPAMPVRAIAVTLSKGLRDQVLTDKVMELIEKEPQFEVRLAAIQTVGAMGVKEALPKLLAILESPHRSHEEKAAAAISYADLAYKPSRSALEEFCKSSREGLRLVACELVLSFNEKENVDLLKPLLKDHSQLVRKGALQVLALLDSKGSKEAIAPLLLDPQKEVKMLAAWALLLQDDQTGAEFLLQSIQSDDQEERLFAAACLVSSARHSKSALQSALYTSTDPLVRLNVALGLISQREEVEESAKAIEKALVTYGDRLMWREEGILRFVAPSDVRFKGDIPQFPEVVNQLVRLELYQLLSYVDYPGAQKAIKSFLEQRTLQTTGIVIALMLTEGGSDSLDIVRPLLQDPDPKTRTQAALILALWGREESVIKELETIYETGDRRAKEKVLEGLGRIGSKRSIPFLIERLGEPQQHLRMIAAASLIECLNH